MVGHLQLYSFYNQIEDLHLIIMLICVVLVTVILIIVTGCTSCPDLKGCCVVRAGTGVYIKLKCVGKVPCSQQWEARAPPPRQQRLAVSCGSAWSKLVGQCVRTCE